MSTKQTTVAVFCKEDNPALKSLPQSDKVKFIIGHSVDAFKSHPQHSEIEGLVIIPPTDNKLLTEQVFPAIPTVKWVHSFYAGVDALQGFISTHLVEGKTHSNTPLTNGRSAFSSSLAEYVLSSCLHFNKKVTHCLSNQANKKWEKFHMPVLFGKQIGFVGYGHIAQTTAKAAKLGFGMKIAALRRQEDWVDPAGIVDKTYGSSNAIELFKESDFVVCTLPGTAETKNFVNSTLLNAMKKSGVFISCGRGTAVDEEAVVQALTTGKIAGAALDVFQVEPLPQDSPLWECPNILITSHNADFTEDYFELGWDVFMKNVDTYQSKSEMFSPVNKSLGY